MGLFSKAQLDVINQAAKKSNEPLKSAKPVSTRSITTELANISKVVQEYFANSKAILIQTEEDLHTYINNSIESGYLSIDTETTGLDRIKDYIVGVCLYYPGGVEAYIPIKHRAPILEELYRNQLTYEQVSKELQRVLDTGSCNQGGTKCIFANADFDLSMMYKDLGVDFCDNCYYDVILAWRCLKENELKNGLKDLYNKYCLGGKGDPKKFSDFFSPQLFPYCRPEVAKLYAANDAFITFEVFKFQLPFVTKTHKKCISNNLQSIADLVWNVEIPLIKVCQNMHRRGVYLEKSTANALNTKYDEMYDRELDKLHSMVQEIIDTPKYAGKGKRPFATGKDFSPTSTMHVKYLLYNMLKLPVGRDGEATGKEILGTFNLPVTNQIAKVRSLSTNINTFVKKLPNSVANDNKIHCRFNSIGASTGRFSSADPNMQNIPSRLTDIRHMFRATPGYVMLSSDYSAQEPRITAYVSKDEKMIKSFQEGKDIYSAIASIAFNVPYEECCEFHPVTGEHQAEGKHRRGEAKTIVLGICYGRSVNTIAEQLYSKENISDEEKVKKAQKVFDSVLLAFPALRTLMNGAQAHAREFGYVETILGRRRHIPDMTLPKFEFRAEPGYVNPDIDPLDITTLDNQETIPSRIIQQLTQEFESYKYFGQRVKRTKELKEEHIRVIDNTRKIGDASRKCVNSIIQGSAAEQTKMAMLLIESDPEWEAIGGRLILPVHDELIAEVPIENWERGAELLSSMMCKAADFLPFDSKCDVEVSYRWYGLSYPCPYPQPNSMENLNEEEVKWVQYHLVECEYAMPVIKHSEDEELKGDAEVGVNGIVSNEYTYAINDYIDKYNISIDQFIEHIHTKVHTGKLPDMKN